VVSVEFAGAGTAAGAGAFIALSASPLNIIATDVSCGSSGGWVNGSPTSSSRRMAAWIDTDTIAPRCSRGFTRRLPYPNRSVLFSTRCST
jgi:hypothetical protein